MKNKKYDFDSFIPPEEIEKMTDKEYYDYLMYNLRKSEDDLKNGRYSDFDEFMDEFEKRKKEQYRYLEENESKGA